MLPMCNLNCQKNCLYTWGTTESKCTRATDGSAECIGSYQITRFLSRSKFIGFVEQTNAFSALFNRPNEWKEEFSFRIYTHSKPQLQYPIVTPLFLMAVSPVGRILFTYYPCKTGTINK